MAELEQLAKQWFKLPLELRLRVPNGEAAERIFAETRNNKP